MRLKITAALLFLLICILPGSKAGFFNGLPLSAMETIFFFFALAAIFGTSWEKIRKLKITLIACLSLLLFFQVLSFKFLPYGWSVCVFSEAAKFPLKSACEPSVEDSSGNTSYTYPSINLTSKSMPLYFLNSTYSFNFYKPGETPRKALPFTLKATAFIYSKNGDQLRIKSDNELLIEVNEEQYVYKKIKKEALVPLEPNSVNHVVITYSAAANENKKILSVKTDSSPFFKDQSTYPEKLVAIYKGINYCLLMIIFACFNYSFLLEFSTLGKKNKYSILFLIASLILLVIFILTESFKFRGLIVYFHMIIVFLSLMLLFSNKITTRKLLPFIFMLMLTSSCILTTSRTYPEEAIILHGGDDELSHESFARKFIPVTNFEEFMSASGEEVFYYQPLHRYFLFPLHKIFGEPMWGPYLVQTLLFCIAIVFIIYILGKYVGLLSALSFLFFYFGLFILDTSHNVVRLLQSPLQQAIGFPLVIIGIAMVISFSKKREIKIGECLALGLIMGASFMIRTDWFPVIFILMIFAFYVLWISFKSGERMKKLLLLLLSFAIFPLLIGFRNYYVAEEFAIFTTSSYVNLNKDLYKEMAGRFEGNKPTSARILSEITTVFSGRYVDLGKILWNNVNQNIIGKNVLRQLLWYITLPLSIAGTFFVARKREYRKLALQAALFSALALLTLSSSLFKPHNGIAMLGVYDYLLILIFASNMQSIFGSWKKWGYWRQKISSWVRMAWITR